MKRFTETTKWDDPWFLDLSPTAKLFWLYLLDKCDNAGVIHLHERKMHFELGTDTKLDDLLNEMDGRVDRLPNGKLHVTGFVAFQFGELKDSSNLHKSVIQLLQKHGLGYPSSTHQEPMPMGPSKGKGKDKVKVDSTENPRFSYGKADVKPTKNQLPITKNQYNLKPLVTALQNRYGTTPDITGLNAAIHQSVQDGFDSAKVQPALDWLSIQTDWKYVKAFNTPNKLREALPAFYARSQEDVDHEERNRREALLTLSRPDNERQADAIPRDELVRRMRS